MIVDSEKILAVQHAKRNVFFCGTRHSYKVRRLRSKAPRLSSQDNGGCCVSPEEVAAVLDPHKAKRSEARSQENRVCSTSAGIVPFALGKSPRTEDRFPSSPTPSSATGALVGVVGALEGSVFELADLFAACREEGGLSNDLTLWVVLPSLLLVRVMVPDIPPRCRSTESFFAKARRCNQSTRPRRNPQTIPSVWSLPRNSVTRRP